MCKGCRGVWRGARSVEDCGEVQRVGMLRGAEGRGVEGCRGVGHFKSLFTSGYAYQPHSKWVIKGNVEL